MARKLSKKIKNPKKVIKKIQPKRIGGVSAVKSKTAAPKIALPTSKYIEAVGRRKVATARVRIYEDSKGEFIVNGKAAGQYFSSVVNAPTLYNKPLTVVGLQGKFTISAKVSGSGPRAQLGAVSHGLSRALIKKDPELRDMLKAEGLLTRDDRMKETRKIGMGGKARRKRQSPRR
jgi:small subunit ribosomal protein S9